MPQYRSDKNILLQSDYIRDENGNIQNGPDGKPLEAKVHVQGEYDFDNHVWVYDLTQEQADLFGAALEVEGATKVDDSAPAAAVESPAPVEAPAAPAGPADSESVVAEVPVAPADSEANLPSADPSAQANFGAPDPIPGQ